MRWLIFLFAITSALPTKAAIKLPRLVSDGAILQRDTELKFWGWGEPGEKVDLTFQNKKYSATTKSTGTWTIKLPAQAAGGPHTLLFTGKNQVAVNDVLFGDVWVCSGQSNMELTMERVKEKYSDVIKTAAYPHIRQFLVADKYDFKKQHTDLDAGSWVSASPESIYNFSAVAYFFALDLYKQYQVPIGLINAALGGSPIEAWLSEDALIQFPNAYQELQRFKNDDLIKEIETTDRNRATKWYSDLNRQDVGLKKWHQPDLQDLDWSNMNLPGYWADGALGNVNGAVWFRKKISIPTAWVGKAGNLWLGRIIDADSAFVNGKFVGSTGYQYPPRRYSFGTDVLRAGENVIAVRVINNSGRGGFVPDKPYFLSVGADTLHLSGEWKYKLGATMQPLQGEPPVRWKPAGLYNHMIAPLLNYKIKGVLWYQGESNTRNAAEYEKLLPSLIRNWRTNWKQGDFPFLIVQLTNFMEAKAQPAESDWARLRQSQLNTLAIKNTGLVVTIDIGEWNDIHPLNKADVGKRLALAARKVAYHESDMIHSGPIYKSYKVSGNKIIIEFSSMGSKLIAKGNDLRYFAIAGANKKFVWANARIEGNTVVVWSDAVEKPVTVRYAWADNPEGANLYNSEGLPASPFSTEYSRSVK
ncbi:MAG: sialate O-acetylesterase [Cyclobacteriaceae bacterium]|nr:sialate O-acetylesterase [Cyclobacteriaceae bacterium]